MKTATSRKPAALPLHIAPIETRLPAYTPEEIAEQAAVVAAAKQAQQDRLDAWMLSCDIDDDAAGCAY